MFIEDRIQCAIFEISSGSNECYLKLQNMVLEGGLSQEDAERFSIYAEKVFLSLSAREKQLLLFLWVKLDPERAYKVVKNDFVNAYEMVKQSVGYLQSAIMCRDNMEHFVVRLNAMEVEKMMRIAFALINDKEIKNGDFMPPVSR